MSKIEWTDRSDWNPIRGCTRVSDGCVNCYAEAIAGRFSDRGQAFHGFAKRTSGGPRWTGKVELIEDRLTLPLRWRRPARIFVNSASDLFHESVPDEWIDRVFAVMALAPQHTFQVLTKRSARMRAWASDPATPRRVHETVCDIAVESVLTNVVLIAPGLDETLAPPGTRVHLGRWPLPNVWLGVSAEDQRRADERVPDLLATPAAVRFVSAEPLLGPIRFWGIDEDAGAYRGCGVNVSGGVTVGTADSPPEGYDDSQPGLDLIIIGGESGPNARPMQVAWARSIVKQCQSTGVSVFVKQMGADPVWGDGAFLNLRDRKGGDPQEWPEDLRVREFPETPWLKAASE